MKNSSELPETPLAIKGVIYGSMETQLQHTFLLAEPFLKDDNFSRTVVYLCHHDDTGSFGLILNRPFPLPLHELITGIDVPDIPVYVGGPVGTDSLHFLHQYPDLIPNSTPVQHPICWGGDFDQVKSLLAEGKISADKVRFFLGYSGWSEGQLRQELDEKTWITTPASSAFLFHDAPEHLWKQILKSLGGEYAPMAEYPLDPQFN